MNKKIKCKKHALISFFALGFGTGLIKPAPGTWGTLLAAILFIFILQFWPLDLLIIFVISCFFAGIWICGQFIRDDPHQDPGEVVWDEIVGFWFACLFLPDKSLIMIGVVFLLFRLFDIAKPFPINKLDYHLSGGLGIMLDDMAAGLFAGVLSYAVYQLFMG